MNEKNTTTETIRINKYLSNAGICSRREADQYTDAGRITADGKKVSTGERISPDSVICLDGKPIHVEKKQVLLLFYKPRGIVCSTKKQRQETTVTEYLNYPLRIYPVGRLDKESEGLLLLTNQGDLVNRIMRAGNYHEKEYLVKVDKEITPEFIRQMANGVPILHTVTRKCLVEKTGKNTFRIILTQGLNRQMRRMCAYLGYQVESSEKDQDYESDPRRSETEHAEILPTERQNLEEMLKGSSNETVTGGHYGNNPAANERSGQKTQSGRQGILSGTDRDAWTTGSTTPCTARLGANGKGNRHRTGRQSNRKRRI